MIEVFMGIGIAFLIFLITMDVNWCKLGIHKYGYLSSEHGITNTVFPNAFNGTYSITTSKCTYCSKLLEIIR